MSSEIKDEELQESNVLYDEAKQEASMSKCV